MPVWFAARAVLVGAAAVNVSGRAGGLADCWYDGARVDQHISGALVAGLRQNHCGHYCALVLPEREQPQASTDSLIAASRRTYRSPPFSQLYADARLPRSPTISGVPRASRHSGAPRRPCVHRDYLQAIGGCLAHPSWWRTPRRVNPWPAMWHGAATALPALTFCCSHCHCCPCRRGAQLTHLISPEPWRRS